MTRARAALIEVFHSIQGEGRHVGVPMTFVRVATCPIRCLYCDTPHSYVAGASFRVAAGDDERREPNPASVERTVELALEAERASPFAPATGARRALSLTGGEPLVYPRFAAELGERLSRDGVALHLETAALDPDALAVALPAVAHLSADYKLPGTLERGDPRAEHLRCIELAAAAACTIDVKIVLTPDVAHAAIESALDALRPFRERILVVLQPVTPCGAVARAPGPQELARSAAAAAARGFDFRVLPQVHKALAIE